jgi:CSLREA domain-containing protein
MMATLVMVATACFPEAPAPTTASTSTTASTTTTEATTTTTVPETSVDVTTFADTDDGVCDEADCSLREAIAAVDAAPVLDTVVLPAGTYVVGGSAPAALRAAPSDGLASGPGLAALSAGPDGEAFRTTTALTIQGAGSGDTIIDFSGDDFHVGWIVEASLTLRDLTVRNLGTGTAKAPRVVVVGLMSDEGQQVSFEDSIVEDVQPDMVADPAVVGGGQLVTSALPGPLGIPPETVTFDVRIDSSIVRHIAHNFTLIQTWGGAVEIVDSTLEDTPPLMLSFYTGGVEYLPKSLSIIGSRLDRLAGLGGFFPTCRAAAIFTAGGQVSGPGQASVEIVDSIVTGLPATAEDAACAGSVASPLYPVYVIGDTRLDITRSQLSSPPGPGYMSAGVMVSSRLDPDTDGCAMPSVTISDSTLWSSEAHGLSVIGCARVPSLIGTGVAIQRSTLAGIALSGNWGDVWTGGLVSSLTIQGSALFTNTALACEAYSEGGVGLVTSLGDNTVDDSSCGPVAPGDQFDTDPLLGPLQDNGGPTWSAAPLPGSPLIDSAGACTGVDQRGVARPQGVACDRGAVELEG